MTRINEDQSGLESDINELLEEDIWRMKIISDTGNRIP